jgi:hypothetical protein
MSSDLHIHIIENQNEEMNVKNYLKSTYWSSRNPIKEINSSELDLENWSRGYTEIFYKEKWYEILNLICFLSEEEFQKADISIKRDIYVWCDTNKVLKTPNIFICESNHVEDSEETDTVKNLENLIYNDRLEVITEDLIAKILKLCSNNRRHKKQVRAFLEKYFDKKCFTVMW